MTHNVGMSKTGVRLRKMTQAEYDRATEAREKEVVRELSSTMSVDDARARFEAGTAQFLPDGLDTHRHHLLTAVDSTGQPVGDAWIGPDPNESPDTTGAAWLYDINVYPPFRRQGYGTGILAAAEELVAGEGAERLGLNVSGTNRGAYELYRRNGYEVTNSQLSKNLSHG